MCKFEMYGNCDPETEDREYCIFHKPKKSEEEAREFWKKFLERFKPKRETIYDEQSRKEIKRFIFEEEIDCDGFVFPVIPRDVDFSFEYAIFKGNARFSESIFEDFANFRNATFGGRIVVYVYYIQRWS